MDKQQTDMFEELGIKKEWEEHWQDMPEFIRIDNMPCQRIVVNFKNQEDVQKFAKLIQQQVTSKTDTLWFPPNKTPTGIFIDES